jgi:glutamyl-tRNA synthetase
MSKKPRLRFAPSPTGGLHLGGVRTVLYNYLFARHHGGDFILRIEDTDQGRYVEGAEQYILDSLAWCGLEPDEGPHRQGAFGPYRQSERKALGIYQKYALQLVHDGHAYYAFDTPAELEEMRERHKSADNPSPQYNHHLRRKMKNSLNMLPGEVDAALKAGTPYVIRIKINADEEVGFTDMIRGEVHFSTTGIDDKVLLKADGMPTYHLAVVVDDRLMEITHAFRGEEWLPSAPVHILLWKYLFGLEHMPQWAHLPLILKPDGNGKLSKRDGDRLGFPVFAMNWTDPKTNEPATGFKETGFLPAAFVNMLAMLGWNDGTNQEIFSIDELIIRFSMDRVHKGGAKFDFEKAKWFNHEWIKRLPASSYSSQVLALFEEKGISIPPNDLLREDAPAPLPDPGLPNTLPAFAPGTDDRGLDLGQDIMLPPGLLPQPPQPAPNRFEKILDLVKDRCTFLPDFVTQASFFFRAPADIDTASVRPKWNEAKQLFFAELIRQFQLQLRWEAATLEAEFKEMAAAAAIKAGDLLMPFRVMLVGAKFGPGVFDIATLLGKEETIRRIRHGLGLLSS